MEEVQVPKRVYKSKMCGHCNKMLQKSAYYEHRKLYYNQKSKQWQTIDELITQSVTSEILLNSPKSHLIDNGDSPLSEVQVCVEPEVKVDSIIPQSEHTNKACTDVDEDAIKGSPAHACFEDQLYIESESDSDSEDDQDSQDIYSPHSHPKKSAIPSVQIETSKDSEPHTLEDTCNTSEEVWDDNDITEAVNMNDIGPIHEESKLPESKFQPLLIASLLFIMMWQNLYGVSDRGITLLLKFMEAFVSMLASLLEVPMLTEFAKIFPTSLYKVRKLLGLNRDKFVKYVACPKCHTVYKFEDCYRVNSRGEKHPLKCSAVKFPNHPQRKRRKPCHAALLKKVISKDGHGYVYPINVYCYKSVRETLETFVRRPDFLKKCNAWRLRNVPNGVLHDIYDGQVWKDFTDNGFFKTDYDLSFTLNVDWFQPFEHSPYSAGALYMIINNLPREERFNPENVILVGLMPGPKEAKKNINSYLQPLVDELEQLLKGVHINDGTLFGNNYRGALMCLSSDIPACRKCGGFVGHGAMRGCSKCLHAFPRAAFGKKADYSNFCMENIEPRTDEDHIFFASQVRNASTPAEQKKFEYEYGARWTELNRLPYYLPVRFHVIDPMHNLLLGTAKHVVEVWKKQKILTSEHFETIQSRVDKLKVPGNVGRIPRKIASGFSGFTAEQWKNWVVLFSSYALKGIIGNDHYNCWNLYVKACKILCSKVITCSELEKAHTFLYQFCTFSSRLYGPEFCTINMHLHLHLKECIFDYGPVYSFWCFSFERYNGILGNFHTNNQSITVQLMRKFIQGQQLDDIQWPQNFTELQGLLTSDRVHAGQGTVGESFVEVRDICHSHEMKVSQDMEKINFAESESVVALPPERRMYFECDDINQLADMYSHLYPTNRIISVIPIAESYNKVLYMGNMIGKEDSRNSRSACIQAKWIGDENRFGYCPVDIESELRPGIVQDIVRSEIIIDMEGKAKKVSFILARVVWLKKHPMKPHFGNHAEVWGTDVECVKGAEFIPIQRIKNMCICVQDKVKFHYCQNTGETVSIIVPLNNMSLPVDFIL